MRKVNLLDCTLRDGGYINNWRFGEMTIKGILEKLAQSGIEMIEVGFLKGDSYDKDCSLFPDIASFQSVLANKRKGVRYVGMLDMSGPIPLNRIPPYDGSSVDGIRVIFKKNKMEDAYAYCRHIKEMGYALFVNFVSTDQYTDREFIESLEHFLDLCPDGVTIVDTFGMMKKKDFSRLVVLADHNLPEEVMLCYHAHNNLQQAFENAQTMVEMNLHRDICIDACVFGMGRGAGNLNLELFAGFMNDTYGTHYSIAPILEIMDEYLKDIYQTKFWGYSLPLYLSASMGIHPNYAIFFEERRTLSVKALRELFQNISENDKRIFNKSAAEKYYRTFMEHYVDDRDAVSDLAKKFSGKGVLLIAPGKSLETHQAAIRESIRRSGRMIVSINFYDPKFRSDYVFCSNMRRFSKITKPSGVVLIATSNISEASLADYVVNFSSYTSEEEAIVDNAGLMCLRLLYSLGVSDVYIAGMDGYVSEHGDNYLDHESNEKEQFVGAEYRNRLMSDELKKLQRMMKMRWLTPARYDVDALEK